MKNNILPYFFVLQHILVTYNFPMIGKKDFIIIKILSLKTNEVLVIVICQQYAYNIL